MNHLPLSILVIATIIALFSCTQPEQTVSVYVENGEFKTAADTLLNMPPKECREEDLLKVGQFFSERAAYHISIPLMEKLLKKDNY